MSMTPESAIERLLPRPTRCIATGQRYVMTAELQVCFFCDDPVVREFLLTSLDEFFPAGMTIKPVCCEQSRAGKPWLSIGDPPVVAEPDDHDEAYTLGVSDRGVSIRGRTAAGLRWGIMTLCQLMFRQEKTIAIAGVTITDQPDYRWRGFQIDSGRSPNSLDKLKRIIRICASFKLNLIIFREGDDEMNAIRYTTNKLGSTNPHAFTIEQFQKLVDYAHHYGIIIVPEIEALGHSQAKAQHYPELLTGGFDEPYEGIGYHWRKSYLLPSDPRGIELIRSMCSELRPCLKSPMIGLGLDEVPADTELQQQHLVKLLEMIQVMTQVSGQPITPLVWSDAPPTPKNYLGKVVRCLWSYADEPAISLDSDHLASQGLAKLSQPGCPERVFMAGGSASDHKPYTKSPYEGAFENLAQWSIWGKDRENFIGLFAVQWSGNMTDDWLPDFLTVADYGWRVPPTVPVFEPQMTRVQYHLGRLIDASTPDPATVDRPAWDAIWLCGNDWDEEILTGRTNQNALHLEKPP